MNPARKNAAATAKLAIGCLIRSSMLAMKIPVFKMKSETPYRLINSLIFRRMDLEEGIRSVLDFKSPLREIIFACVVILKCF